MGRSIWRVSEFRRDDGYSGRQRFGVPPDRPIRLFAAIYPPPEAAERMLRLLDHRVPGRYRATPVEQVHVTVQFIGGVPLRELDATVESVARAVSGLPAFTLEPVRLISLPERRTPRLIALETSAPPPLPELHRRLVQRLARRPREPMRDRFLPHFTLARYPHDARPARIEKAVSLEAIPVREVRLMRSVLRPDGAEHTAVAFWPLSP